MIERAFEEARKHNRGIVKRFALDRARDILRAAKIIDPEITETQSAKTRVVRKEAVIPEITLEAFLEGKRRESLVIGGKSAQQLEKELEQAGINISLYARDMIHSPDFTTLKDPRELETVRVKVQDLRLSGNPTTSQIYIRAQELGLELCPAEVGPHMRLAYKDQPMNEWFVIGMKQITDRDGNPGVFHLVRYGGGVWLAGHWAGPDGGWDPGDGFVFSLRKDTPKP